MAETSASEAAGSVTQPMAGTTGTGTPSCEKGSLDVDGQGCMDYVAGSMIAEAPVPVPSAPPVPLPKTPPHGPDGTLWRSRPWWAAVSQAPCTPLGSSPRSPIQCDHRVEEGLAKSWNSIRGEAMIENESRVESNIAAFDRFLFEIRARRQHEASKRPSPRTPPKVYDASVAGALNSTAAADGAVAANPGGGTPSYARPKAPASPTSSSPPSTIRRPRSRSPPSFRSSGSASTLDREDYGV